MKAICGISSIRLPRGTVGEAASKFGAVSSSSGTIDGAVPINDLQKTLGYSAVSGEGFDQVKSAWISPSQEMTLMLNVDAVNEALLRPGIRSIATGIYRWQADNSGYS